MKHRKARIVNPPTDTPDFRPVRHEDLVNLSAEDSFGGRFYDGDTDTSPVIEFRVSGEFSKKALYLNQMHFDFELVYDNEDSLILLPTRKAKK